MTEQGKWSFDLVGPIGEKLFQPSSACVAPTGEFVVADADSCFIVIYSTQGLYLTHFSTIPKRLFYIFLDPSTHAPQDVACLSNNKIVYSQPRGPCVIVCDWTGARSLVIQGRPLYRPYGICVDHQDRIYVTDTEKGRVLCFTAGGKLLRGVGMFGSGEIMHNPHYVTALTNGMIVVNDLQQGQIFLKIFHTNTNSSHICMLSGKQEGNSVAVCNFVVFDGHVLYADKKNSAINVVSMFADDKEECHASAQDEVPETFCVENLSYILHVDSKHIAYIDHVNKKLCFVSISDILDQK